MIAACSVTVDVDGKRLLDAVDVEVRPGEVVAVVGPNGAGKSTLLSVLSGDRTPTSGSVTVDGHDLGSWSAVELGQRRAVLPQSTPLSFPFRVCEVVAMGRAPWRRSPDRARDAAEVARAMAETEVTALADRVHTTLSGGEQARVHLARVLAQRAAVLLLDEPTAALDLRHQQLVLGVARKRADAGAGVLAVLHDLGLAGAADRVVVLSAGRVVAHGAPMEVLRADLVEEVYRQPVHVVAHPTTGAPVVVPRPAT